MELITVREIYRNKEEYIGKQIQVGGWIRSIRDSKAFGFIVLSDGSFFEPLQIVYHDTMDNFAQVSKLNVGSAIIVTGTLVATLFSACVPSSPMRSTNFSRREILFTCTHP